eukprot:7389282-Prymnesium_polylepis.1
MDSFVTATPREDDDAPPLPKACIGKLAKGERPASLPRGKDALIKFVPEWANWGMKQKNTGTEQFRYLVRTMSEIEEMLRSSETTLKQFKAEIEGAHPASPTNRLA